MRGGNAFRIGAILGACYLLFAGVWECAGCSCGSEIKRYPDAYMHSLELFTKVPVSDMQFSAIGIALGSEIAAWCKAKFPGNGSKCLDRTVFAWAGAKVWINPGPAYPPVCNGAYACAWPTEGVMHVSYDPDRVDRSAAVANAIFHEARHIAQWRVNGAIGGAIDHCHSDPTWWYVSTCNKD